MLLAFCSGFSGTDTCVSWSLLADILCPVTNQGDICVF